MNRNPDIQRLYGRRKCVTPPSSCPQKAARPSLRIAATVPGSNGPISDVDIKPLRRAGKAPVSKIRVAHPAPPSRNSAVAPASPRTVGELAERRHEQSMQFHRELMQRGFPEPPTRVPSKHSIEHPAKQGDAPGTAASLATGKRLEPRPVVRKGQAKVPTTTKEPSTVASVVGLDADPADNVPAILKVGKARPVGAAAASPRLGSLPREGSVERCGRRRVVNPPRAASLEPAARTGVDGGAPRGLRFAASSKVRQTSVSSLFTGDHPGVSVRRVSGIRRAAASRTDVVSHVDPGPDWLRTTAHTTYSVAALSPRASSVSRAVQRTGTAPTSNVARIERKKVIDPLEHHVDAPGVLRARCKAAIPGKGTIDEPYCPRVLGAESPPRRETPRRRVIHVEATRSPRRGAESNRGTCNFLTWQ